MHENEKDREARRREAGYTMIELLVVLVFIAIIALIALNAATFPWPPADRGLFDIGPFIALYFVAVAARLIMLRRPAAR